MKSCAANSVCCVRCRATCASVLAIVLSGRRRIRGLSLVRISGNPGRVLHRRGTVGVEQVRLGYPF